MKTSFAFKFTRRSWVAWLLAMAGQVAGTGRRSAQAIAETATEAATQILIVVGPSTHPPGTHEVAAGARVMQHCLEHSEDLPGIKATIVDRWPAESALLEQIDAVVFIGDIFPIQRLENREVALQQLNNMMRRGCGIVCVHYATGLRAEDVQDNGDHPLLHWTGGYFATQCKHHQSVAKVFPQATIDPALAEHPVCRGWRSFTVHDEPYIKNFFGNEQVRPGSPTLTFATSLLPPESPQAERVAWGIERADSGRGFAVVMPHFYRNWNEANLRRLILNGIVWTAKREVPAAGVVSTLPDLQQFL